MYVYENYVIPLSTTNFPFWKREIFGRDEKFRNEFFVDGRVFRICSNRKAFSRNLELERYKREKKREKEGEREKGKMADRAINLCVKRNHPFQPLSSGQEEGTYERSPGGLWGKQ